ncbi:outer membrane immunogenic protein [Microvirga flocculans]|uniref:Outer membrane immunogenic protein n=1 Tax=Microvirga flocculans TaxID=217168 RepID=A0A7W6IDR3_9HYPH|nr:porin family protein [Microvirga flocculans]MBB4039544.1 outer membrane immunogenic protein [Microvirga flocculans]
MRNCVLRLLSGVAGLTLAAAAVSAADLARPAPPPVIAAPPIFTWTGFYGGINLGWGWRDSNRETVVLGGAVPGTLYFPDNGDGGFTGGAQIGYNYQMGSFVIGVETDIQWADTNSDETVAFIPAGAPGTFVPGEFSNDFSDWFGTLRARAGVAFDRVLIYATGGLAYSDNNTGWVAGGGVEWALPVNWFGSSAVTFGVEGLWLSFNNDNNNNFNGFVGTFTPAGGAPIAVVAPAVGNDDNDFFVARAKLNFKFGTY